MLDLKLTDKRAPLVTGSTSGIGEAWSFTASTAQAVRTRA
jgi:hypothetical protein